MNENNEQIPVFEIKVKNKFDEDKRALVVTHLERVKQKETSYTIGYIESPDQTPPEKLFALTPDDSLIIEIDQEYGDFNKDIHIELPYVADYRLFWEVGGERVDRPISSIIRDTSSDKDGRLDEGRTIIIIPRDQRAWKLEIRSPRNLKEHYQTRNLIDKYLEMDNGYPDDASVGDNGPGVRSE
jgi:hypothetical protein